MSVFVRPDSDVRRAGAEVIHRKHRLFQLVVVQLERAVFIAVAGLGVTEIIIVVGCSGDLGGVLGSVIAAPHFHVSILEFA